jgi:hypothetical protein
MNTIDHIMAALDERNIAREVGNIHDEARLRFPLERNTVESFDEFSDLTGDYFNYHFSRCVANGGRFSPADASGRAKALLERAYRRRNGDIVSAYNDAHDGTNGGMRVILDVLADGLKEEAVEHYVRYVFDRLIAPNAWGAKVRIIEQFIERCGPQLADSIQRNQPERYAQNYRDLIAAFVQGLRQTSSMFRSL